MLSGMDWAIVGIIRRFLKQNAKRSVEITTVKTINNDELVKDKYCVNIKVKQRYIVPLVEENNQFVRVDTISETAKKDIDSFLNYKPKKYAYLNFNF